MSGVCAEQNNKFHSSHQLYHHPIKKASPFHHIDIPPRKLIFSRRDNINSDMFSDSPKFSSPNETLLRKFLPYNDGGDGDDEDFSDGENDPYSSDHFRMFEFKVRRCTRSRSHDWTDCPFAHPGEKARRRDPRRFHYSGAVCPEFRQGGCSRGDNCEFAHGVFECWLHPARYRTEACKDGKNCKRKVCFFAHTPQQLRILPPNSGGGGGASAEISPVSSEKKFRNLLSNSPNSNHCCVYCHSVTSSPTSTLMGIPHFSPPASPSPPLSPVSRRCSGSKFTPFCRYGGGGDRLMASDNCDLKKNSNNNAGLMSYKDVVTELMSSLEAMNVNEGSHAGSSNGNGNQLWVDVCEDQQQQQQFILSPSNPNYPSGSSRDFYKNKNSSSNIDDKQVNADNNGWSCPDLGWVNDLLM